MEKNEVWKIYLGKFALQNFLKDAWPKKAIRIDYL